MAQSVQKNCNFPKEERAFTIWLDGETFAEIVMTAGVAEATAQIYVIDMIANGVKRKDLHERLVREMEIQDESLEELHDLLCGRGVTLRELRDTTQLSYHEQRHPQDLVVVQNAARGIP